VRISRLEVPQDPPQGFVKLNALGRGQHKGLVVDPKEREVTDCVWAAIPLGYHPEGKQAQLQFIEHQLSRQQGPLALAYHVHKLLAKERDMLSGWLVGTSGEGSCFLGEGPQGAATGNGGSSNSETIQQVGCWMGDSPDLGMEVSVSISDLGDKLLPA
jgi:hypothetical protein